MGVSVTSIRIAGVVRRKVDISFLGKGILGDDTLRPVSNTRSFCLVVACRCCWMVLETVVKSLECGEVWW